MKKRRFWHELFSRLRRSKAQPEAAQAAPPPTDADRADVELRAAQAAESILDNESLTSELDDAAAQILLNWGADWARRVARRTAGMDEAAAQEAMVAPMAALRQLVRMINKRAGGNVPGDAAAWWARLIEQGSIAAAAALTSPINPELLWSDDAADLPGQIGRLRAWFEAQAGGGQPNL